MKNLLYFSIIFLSFASISYAQMGPGTTCPSTAPCYVIISGGGGGSLTANQGTQAANASGSTWFVQEYLGGSAVSLTNPVPVTPGTGSTFPVSGTVAATQSGTWNIGSVTTLPSITVSSSALPTGASTSANQTSVQSAPGTPQTTALTVQGNASGVALPVSAASLPLPSGAATAANQTTANSSLATIATNTTGASTAANQISVQSAPGTPQTTALTVQGNASGIPENSNVYQGGSAVSSSNGLYVRSQGFTSTSFRGNTSGTMNTFTSVLAANSSRNGCTIQNTSNAVEYVFFGANASATTSNSIQLAAGQTISCNSGNIVLTDNISMASAMPTKSYVGFSQ